MKATLRFMLTASAMVYGVTLCGALSSASAEEKPHAATSTSASKAAQKQFSVLVGANQALVPAAYRMSEGETAEFTIQLPYSGALAIHGYTRDMPISANVAMTFNLAGTRTGRFPMHVHTTDGRHVEIGVLEVMPR